MKFINIYIHDLYILWNIIRNIWLFIALQSHTHLMKKHDLIVFKNNWLDFCWLSSGWSWSLYEQWACRSFDEWPGTMFMLYICNIIKSTIKSFPYCSYFYWWQCTLSSLSICILCWNAILGDNSMNSSVVWNVTEFTYVHYWICCNCFL